MQKTGVSECYRATVCERAALTHAPDSYTPKADNANEADNWIERDWSVSNELKLDLAHRIQVSIVYFRCVLLGPIIEVLVDLLRHIIFIRGLAQLGIGLWLFRCHLGLSGGDGLLYFFRSFHGELTSGESEV